ncbi:MAG: DUF2877 domain-containing protein [Thermoplasmata archaeon]
MIDVLKTGLRAAPTGTGSILHRSLRAVNVEFGGHVVTLLNRKGILTASSVVLDTEQIPAINCAEFDGDILHTDSFVALMKNRIDLALHSEGGASTISIRNSLQHHIIPRERSIMSAVLVAEGYINQASAEGFEAEVLEEQARRIRTCRSVEDATRTLLGIGFGLTPSGDDFILGSIAVMQLTGHRTEGLRPLIAGYNNAFSRTMLLDGLDGYFPQPLLEVLQAMDSGNNPDDKIFELERIGHTSGFDMVAGMYYTASNLLH